jgi:pimeloyl-ACP methyl ester carboxylesterase
MQYGGISVTFMFMLYIYLITLYVNVSPDVLLMIPSLFYRSEDHDEIKRLFPAAKFETIAGAGHWVHADKPNELLAVIKDFIQNTEKREESS